MIKLRRWQQECIDTARAHFTHTPHFMCLATPGAGKSVMAAELSRQMLESGDVDFILCFSPSNIVADGLRNTFSKLLGSRFDGMFGSKGCSYTYQSMRYIEDLIFNLVMEFRVLVICDEIHHCAGDSLENANSWGEQMIQSIRNKAKYTIALSGTPWRSDQIPVSLARYDPSANSIICDYMYGLGDAIRDDVCRIPKVVLIDNDIIEVHEEGGDPETFKGFDDLFSRSKISYQSVLSEENAITHLLSQACLKLDQVRKENRNAGGLVVASSIQHANQIARLLRNKLSKSVTVVSHHQNNAVDIINDFRNSSMEWIVSVGMISEGTDIPRLQVCCHLSRVRTELYFRQVLGRILRVNNDLHKFAWLYSFAEPSITKFAENLDQEIPDCDVLLKNTWKLDDSYKYNDIEFSSYESESSDIEIVYGGYEQLAIDDIDAGNDHVFYDLRISEDFRQKVIDLFSYGLTANNESC